MRLWSLHPKYLDSRGLVAAWREALLAQKVLQGGTQGYRSHPQLIRFRNCPDPLGAMAVYLKGILEEAKRRGYAFDETKIGVAGSVDRLPVTRGQVLYEWRRLKEKLGRRDPPRLMAISALEMPEVHPLFRVVQDGVESWEKIP